MLILRLANQQQAVDLAAVDVEVGTFDLAAVDVDLADVHQDIPGLAFFFLQIPLFSC